MKKSLVGSRVIDKIEVEEEENNIDLELSDDEDRQEEKAPPKKENPKQAFYSYLRIFSKRPSLELRQMLEEKFLKIKFHLRSKDIEFIRLMRTWEQLIPLGDENVFTLLIIFHSQTMAENKSVIEMLMKESIKLHFEKFLRLYYKIATDLEPGIILTAINSWNEAELFEHRKIIESLSKKSMRTEMFKQNCLDKIDLRILEVQRLKLEEVNKTPTPIPTSIYIN